MAWWDHEELKPAELRSDRYKVAFPEEYTSAEVAAAKRRIEESDRRVPRYDPDDTSITALASQEKPAFDWKPDHVTHRSYMSGWVKRYSVWPTINHQVVGAHCWGVYETYWRIFGMPSAEVAFYIHHHDSEEVVVGDNPFPSKMAFPKLKEATTEVEAFARQRLGLPEPTLSHFDRVRVKVCDLVEMMQFGMVEREMGNLLATPIIERTGDKALEVAQYELSQTEFNLVLRFVGGERERHRSVLEKKGSTY